MTEADLPALFQRTDAASRRGQRRYLLATRVSLLLGVLAAIGGAITLKDETVDWASVGATVAFVLAILVGVYVLAERPDREWYEGRAGAESVKTLAWRYAVGGSDFPIGAADADSECVRRLGTIMRNLRHVRLVGAGGDQITEAMRRLRDSAFEARKGAYRASRIGDQRDWYSRAAGRNERLAIAWRLAALACQFVGVIGGLLKATGIIDFDLLGIAAAGSAAAVAWLQTKEHATLAQAYSVAEQELALADSEIEAADEAEWPTAVDNTEQAISREHTLWRARRTSFEHP